MINFLTYIRSGGLLENKSVPINLAKEFRFELKEIFLYRVSHTCHEYVDHVDDELTAAAARVTFGVIHGLGERSVGQESGEAKNDQHDPV